MTMNDKDIVRHIEAASRIEADKETVGNDIERVRNMLEENANEKSASDGGGYINYGVVFKYAAIFVAAVLFGLTAHYGLPIDGSSVAWADVVEKFRSIDHFSGVLYIRERISEEPQQIEIWMGEGCRSRIRIGEQVLFGKDGMAVAGFDFAGRRKLKAEEYEELGENLIESFGSESEFSLDTIVNLMCGKPVLEEVTPKVNADAGISEDLVVFDLTSENSPQWLRIWALKNSLLPVRVRVWDPRESEQVDFIISYSKPQSDDFFDPESYADAILKKNNDGRFNRAYALHKDTGGKAVVPKELFEESGYHVPEIDRVGITENGAVWVVAKKAQNRKPDGRTFYGLRKLKDDLDREYVKLWSSWSIEDISVEVFAPKDYPFDERVPGKLKLPCKVEEHHPQKKGELIGTVELTEWEQDAAIKWPFSRLERSEYGLMLTMADNHCRSRSFDKCEKIFKIIKDAGLYDKYELQIDRLRLRILLKKGEFETAAELAMELWPVEIEKYKNPGKARPSSHVFAEPIAAVAASGNIDRAAELWKEVKSIKPDISKFSKPAQEHFRENIKRGIEVPRHLVDKLSVHISVEKINKIVGFDVRKHEEFKHYNYKSEAEKAKELAAQNYVKQLAARYKNNPLPEKMELIEREDDPFKSKHSQGGVFSFRWLPGHKEYCLWPINCGIEHIVTWGVRFSEPIIPSQSLEVKFSNSIPDKVLKKIIHADMVYHKDVKVADRFMYVADKYLEEFGLELVELDGPMRKVLVARYDGRKLRDYRQVNAVLEVGEKGKPGGISIRANYGLTIRSLFDNLVNTQNINIVHEEDKVLLIDETGIEGLVSMIARDWPGEEGLKMAKEWFKEEFGVTIVEEERAMPVWEVRLK